MEFVGYGQLYNDGKDYRIFASHLINKITYIKIAYADDYNADGTLYLASLESFRRLSSTEWLRYHGRQFDRRQAPTLGSRRSGLYERRVYSLKWYVDDRRIADDDRRYGMTWRRKHYRRMMDIQVALINREAEEDVYPILGVFADESHDILQGE